MALPARQRGKTAPQAQRTKGVHLSAPVGGLNSSAAASAMPVTDCLALTNLIPYQYGLRVRSGYREWCTQLGLASQFSGTELAFELGTSFGAEAVPYPVLTLLSFTGSKSDGTSDRLFACTRAGILDVTGPTDTPTTVFSFPLQSSKSGKGVATAFANTAGTHYLAYCDSVNGYLLYSEATDSWSQVLEGTGAGQVEGADPTTFRFVMSWKNRLWFVPENSQKALYLPIGQYAGEVNPIYFGARFRYGGELVGLWNWTLDGGAGVDDNLVGISRGGDVVVYQGIDPAVTNAFELRGTYWVGPVPPGRTIATDFGGDLFILAAAGCIPLSRLVSGGLIRDPSIYVTYKVANIFNTLMSTRGTLEGWSVRIHPSDNLLLVNVPGLYGADPEQLSMSLANQGWSRLTGLPMTCMETWKGKLFFGTTDARVCINEGYVDNQQLGGLNAQAIDWALLTAYQNLGSTAKKRIHMVRPRFITDGTKPGYSVQARYDYDLTTVSPAPVAADTTENSWDYGLWDGALWVETGTAGTQAGTTGIGVSMAVVLRGTSTTNTTLVGFDIMTDSGGLL